MLTGKQNPIPATAIGVVDVRDVAAAYVQSIKVDAAKGHRIITQNESAWRIDMAKIIAEEFGPKGWPVCTTEGPKTDDTQSKVDDHPFRNILGLSYRPLKETLIDMCNSMIESGFAKKPE